MCAPPSSEDTDGSQAPQSSPPANERTRNDGDDFPWDAGVCDAHCHPTDTMSSVPFIPDMGARCLTVMSTRSQDQDLVASAAEEHGVRSLEELSRPGSDASDPPRKLIPAFGWHPWFSHQLYDDTGAAAAGSFDPSDPKHKAQHYASVLTPPPPPEFLAGLPAPQPLSAFLAATRARLAAHPLALVGEVGLDRAFRLPRAWADDEAAARDGSLTPGGREGRTLSAHRVAAPHQAAVLRAQLALAGEMGRAVSVHGVQAHGQLYDVLRGMWKGHERRGVSARDRKMIAKGVDEDFSSSSEEEEDDDEGGAGGGKKKMQKRVKPKPYPPRICLHSFSGPVEVMKQYTEDKRIPAKVFFSFSVCINFSTAGGEARTPEVIRACPDDRILVESDLHTAGPRMDQFLEDMYRRVCEIKGWGLREGIERIRRNYEEFIFG
ncbi:Cut9-interacting protein scn1 [Pleurostoma richardsiae]|uniref:Cut9-interacting protein scn1 n=1 Tax=Pleurostoma richardsiae TaxID=41990 RepID=A0AA38R4W9_9PEZI|nr:Cut9-interacting protein scn1 [Pleurostoma richardsiae]